MKNDELDFNSDKKIKLLGNIQKAGGYLPFAKSKLDVIYKNYIEHDSNQSKTFILENNSVVINIKVVNGERFITINANDSKPCVEGVSGIGKMSAIGNDAGLNYFYPSVYQNEKEQDQTNEDIPRVFRTQTGIGTPLIEGYFNITSDPAYSQHRYLKSSMYTGFMQKAIQQLLGKGAQIYFDYSFERTHLLFLLRDEFIKNNPTDPTNTDKDIWKWILCVVEIGKNGIYYKYIDHCVPRLRELEASNYYIERGSFPFQLREYGFPFGEKLESLLATDEEVEGLTDGQRHLLLKEGKIIRERSAEDMKIFYDGAQPFFKEQGWVDGRSQLVTVAIASNICIKSDYIIDFVLNINPFSARSILSSQPTNKLYSSNCILIPDYEARCNKTLEIGIPYDNSIGIRDFDFNIRFLYIEYPPPSSKYKLPFNKEAIDFPVINSLRDELQYSRSEIRDENGILIKVRYIVPVDQTLRFFPRFDRTGSIRIIAFSYYCTEYNADESIIINSGFIDKDQLLAVDSVLLPNPNNDVTIQYFNQVKGNLFYDVRNIDYAEFNEIYFNQKTVSDNIICDIHVDSYQNFELEPLQYLRIYAKFLGSDFTNNFQDYPIEDYDDFSWIGEFT